MQVDPLELKKRYDSMSQEEFSRINPHDLTNEARRLFEDALCPDPPDRYSTASGAQIQERKKGIRFRRSKIRRRGSNRFRCGAALKTFSGVLLCAAD
jgi:hypothetical protein